MSVPDVHATSYFFILFMKMETSKILFMLLNGTQ